VAAKKNFYAIRCGRDSETGEAVSNRLCLAWDEARRFVHGAPGAVFAGFTTRMEAELWLEAGKLTTGECDDAGAVTPASKNKAPLRKKTSVYAKPIKIPDGLPSDALCCYVDGSFNENLPNYGYGLVCVLDGKIIHSDGGAGTNAEAVSMRQIAGELLGAIQGLLYARKNGYAKVIILHDYLGVAHHATGVWKRANPFSVTYHEWMQRFFRDNPGIRVTFRKVPAHAGLYHNELADVLAKLSVGMVPDSTWLTRAREAGLQMPDVVP